MGRRPINEKVIFGITLLIATAAMIDARGYARGTAQLINGWSPLVLNCFLITQAIAALLFLAFGLSGRHMHRPLFTVCVMTTAVFVGLSAYYVAITPGTSKVALAYEGGFLLVLFWHLYNRPPEVWP